PKSSRPLRNPGQVDAARPAGGPALFAGAKRCFSLVREAPIESLLAPPDCMHVTGIVGRQPAAVHRAGPEMPGALAQFSRGIPCAAAVAGTDEVHVAIIGDVVPPEDVDAAGRIEAGRRLATWADAAGRRFIDELVLAPGRAAVFRECAEQLRLAVAEIDPDAKEPAIGGGNQVVQPFPRRSGWPV